MLLPVYRRLPLTFVSGEGSWLYDDKGEKYLDFVSGVAVNALGHSHPKIIQAIQSQAENLIHVSNLFHNEGEWKLTQQLIDQSDFDHVFYTNSGTESIEFALKIARKHGRSLHKDKTEIIFMENSFHGRTFGALSVTGQEKYQAEFHPLLPNVKMVPFNDIEALECAVSDRTCAIIMEPIQGESGVNLAHQEFVLKARELCDDYDAFLIFDEIQTGIGRTGTLFMYQQLNVIPDIMALAKALGGGMPIGAILTRQAASYAVSYGDHGSTYGGNPLVCTVASTLITEITESAIMTHVAEVGAFAKTEIQKRFQAFDSFVEVRGVGLMIGIVFDESKILNTEIVHAALQEKLLVISGGNNIIRFYPPLIATQDEILDGIIRLEKTLKRLEK